MNTKIGVLNGGFVRLVSYMQPVPEDREVEFFKDAKPVKGMKAVSLETEVVKVQPGGWNGDLEIVRNARVSYDADFRTGEDAGKDEKLINYLYENKHTSPFEAMVFTFEVKAPIFVFRQWHRHRTWSYNELSARYAPLDEGFYIPDPNKLGKQSQSHKQMRDMKDEFSENMKSAIVEDIQRVCYEAHDVYKSLLECGVPREIARGVLPVNAYSRMFATVDLHNLFHFLRLRLHAHAQYEIRVYAEAILELIRPVVPMAVKAFESTLMSPEEKARRGLK